MTSKTQTILKNLPCITKIFRTNQLVKNILKLRTEIFKPTLVKQFWKPPLFRLNYFFDFTHFRLISLIIFLSIASNTSNSQILDSQFYRWKVYEIQDEEDPDFKKCYIVNHPVFSNSDYNSRLKPYIMITRYQKDRIEEISAYGGYEYKLSSEIFFLVDDLQFRLKTKGDIAWARTRYEDIKIIEAMLNGGVVRVRSDSAIGRYGIDEYSLKGITRAYLRMREICT